MAHFWANHFYIFGRKEATIYLMPAHEREAMRPFAFTTFRQLLGASCKSPAMLVYLDNAQSHRSAPNENFGRELLELHTLGVGAYTEDDVKASARIFTGRSIFLPEVQDQPEVGDYTYAFRRAFHDNEPKLFLGTTIAPEAELDGVPPGEAEGERALDLLAAHPATARFISTKLARRFVADFPPEALVERLAAMFTASNGDVPTLLRTIVDSAEFWDSPPKLKNPFEYTISVLRALGCTIEDDGQAFRVIGQVLDNMGYVPFSWPAPNGFPDVAGAWSATLLTRWNVALAAVSDDVPGISIGRDRLVALLEAHGVPLEPEPIFDFMADYLYGRPLNADERAVILEFSSQGETDAQIAAGLALMLASPAFQYR